MEFLTVKKASTLWKISTRRITTLCEQGRIPGAVKAAGVWLMPVHSKKPYDTRIKTGNYIGWRSKNKLSEFDFESNIKNIEGTFKVEGMELSETSKKNLKRLEDGSVLLNEVIEELTKKYTTKRV